MPCSTVIELASALDVQRVITTSANLVVIDFFAEWCGPCRALAPVLVGMAQQHVNVDFYKVDVDRVPDVADQMSVVSLPTVVFFRGGAEVARVVGANKTQIEATVAKYGKK